MNWLDKLERKYGKYAIHGLMNYVIALTAVVYILSMFDYTFENRLALIPQYVMAGQVWRLFTYIFIPPTYSLIFIVFALYLYHMIGNALEQEWGAFHFNVYYLLGMLGTTVATFATGGYGTSFYMNLSLFLAFARLYPDVEFLLFFILPVKVKYLAWLDWAFIVYTVVFGALPDKISAIVSIINYFVFFGRDIITTGNRNRKNQKRKQQFKVIRNENFTYHRCTTCGKTEKDDKFLEFRYCPECEGDYEYCMEHVRNHQHVKKDLLN